MKLLDLCNVTTADVTVYYRQVYQALAIFEINSREVSVPVDLTIDISPLGQKTMHVVLKDSVDYPIMPLIKAVRNRALEMYNSGYI